MLVKIKDIESEVEAEYSSVCIFINNIYKIGVFEGSIVIDKGDGKFIERCTGTAKILDVYY